MGVLKRVRSATDLIGTGLTVVVVVSVLAAAVAVVAGWTADHPGWGMVIGVLILALAPVGYLAYVKAAEEWARRSLDIEWQAPDGIHSGQFDTGRLVVLVPNLYAFNHSEKRKVTLSFELNVTIDGVRSSIGALPYDSERKAGHPLFDRGAWWANPKEIRPGNNFRGDLGFVVVHSPTVNVSCTNPTLFVTDIATGRQWELPVPYREAG